ncbi:alpha-D-ribose 1-methylphosphonate 5-triphosphate diphosphatase [Bacillus thermophilus]|uniref:Alpha-D-ribose 1-methylphosphonate 5-triphosphate diphosphatase n=1 Tax=Siminovitchia thermophila TaxID=1245522 RepID=A0ABS2R974_9BACI|nr:phosphonate metabolism protein PhnM [Siminovitchia thermophila]MBM7715920.1 alpha-D-ribose 1-methylphosphonate 5-triphosphate diphosphatase [Siminovitchia thermophila]ONK21554.1 alpha-D-ribose 1-methylphosphonate 5-triphosphate diphosphatase [Bacillus sp. VT-16-64]
MYLLTNGQLVLENQILSEHAVVIENDSIVDIIPEQDAVKYKGYKILDANGGYISPGFVDIHSDYIEGIISPRPTSMMDFTLGIREAERILISHGITTMFHSLSIYKDDSFGKKPIRHSENVNRLINAINETHTSKHLIRNRMHARFEIDNIEQVNIFIQNIQEEKVHLISFMDHTPGQGQFRNLEIYRETLKGYNDISDAEIDEIITNGMKKNKITLEQMREISKIALDKNIAIASHDDDEIEKLTLVKSYGTSISEFPTSLEVAKAAKEMGLWTIAGAPNVMLGGSHSGNLCATEAIREDVIDILCSDYYPPALLHALFKLSEEHDMALHKMFQLVTLNPAKAVRMDDQIGSIKKGKKADIIIIEKMDDGYPVITASFVDGKLITRTNYR